MANLQFGIWDSFGAETMSRAPVAADVYREHIGEAKLGEELGYEYYFIIEHQNSAVGQISAPNVFLCALAQHTSRIRIGAMIYQLPMHNPMRLAQEAAMLDHLSQGRLDFGAGLGNSRARVHALEPGFLGAPGNGGRGHGHHFESLVRGKRDPLGQVLVV